MQRYSGEIISCPVCTCNSIVKVSMHAKHYLIGSCIGTLDEYLLIVLLTHYAFSVYCLPQPFPVLCIRALA